MRKRKKTLKTKESIHWCVPVSSRRGGCPSCWPSVYAQARTPPCTCWFLTLKTQGNNKEYTKYDNKHRRNPRVYSVKIFGFPRWIMKSMKYIIFSRCNPNVVFVDHSSSHLWETLLGTILIGLASVIVYLINKIFAIRLCLWNTKYLDIMDISLSYKTILKVYTFNFTTKCIF